MVCVKAIQIIAPDNHTLALQLEDFRYIFEADNIKDRHVSIVSIAGAFRKGKSFLLNFFLKYLYAQVKFIGYIKIVHVDIIYTHFFQCNT